MACSTRQKDGIFIFGVRDLQPLTRFNQLPTLRQTLLRFHELLRIKKSVRNAAHYVIEELIEVWDKAFIPTNEARNCIDKLERIHKRWLLLKKNKFRASQSQKDREKSFVEELDQLFDIARADALDMIKIDEDRTFLIDQRQDRKMAMTSFDKKAEKVNERSQKRKLRAEELRQKANQNAVSTSVTSNQLELSFSSSSSEQLENDDYIPIMQKKPKEASALTSGDLPSTSKVLTSHVLSAMDRNNISDRKAAKLIIPIAASLGYNPSALPVSRSSIRRERKKARIEFHAEIKASFTTEYPLVVHWDGKRLPDHINNKKVERLPILVSGDGGEKLLGVPKLKDGTGEQIASAVCKLLEEWELKGQVSSMSFDTTSSNTGYKSGACALLEIKLDRHLLWLACRHHVLEIILSKVFNLCFGPSVSPEIQLFKRFKEVWENISRDSYTTLDLSSASNLLAQNTLAVIERTDTLENTRDDYQELVELTLVVLNKPPTKIHWRAPGPIHHARWMAKLLYAFKIFLFKNQKNKFNLTNEEEKQISRFVKFGAMIYTQAWVQAPLAAEAPYCDLQLWKNLKAYEEMDSEIGNAARNVLERHLWYLSDELIGLALFSDNLTCLQKAEIIRGMNVEPGPRKVRGSPQMLTPQSTLGDFATKRTAETLSKLNIRDSFLKLSSETWNDNLDYLEGKTRIKHLRVVNDTAERGVKLFEEFSKSLTKDEDEKQFLLQVVELNRKLISADITKKSLIEIVSNKTH